MSETEQKTELSIKTDRFTDLCRNLGKARKESTRTTLVDDSTLSEMYISNGLSKRIIDSFADDMTRQGMKVKGDTDEVINDYLDSIDGFPSVNQALKWEYLYGGSAIYMIIDDGKKAFEPVNVATIKGIKKLVVLDRTQVQVKDRYKTADENFGLPETYSINSNDVPFDIHESRMLTFTGDKIPYSLQGLLGYDKYWGMSIIQPIFDVVKDYDLVFTAVMDALKKSNLQYLKITDIMNLLSTEDGKTSLYNRLYAMDNALSVNNTTILDTTEEFGIVSQSFAGIMDLISKIQEKIASEVGKPVTVLFGTSAKGLNATGDNEIRTYYDLIKAKQRSQLEPQLNKLIDYIKNIPELKLSKAESYTIEFNPLWQLSEPEEVKMRREQAEVDKIYLDYGVLDVEEVRQSRFGGDEYSIETTVEGKAPVVEVIEETSTVE